jgi:hypothetical protein
MTSSDDTENRALPAPKLVSVQSDANVPSWLAERLLHPGVPHDLLGTRYRVTPLAVRREPPHAHVVEFGVGGRQARFGVDTDTRAVIWQPTAVSPALYPVNATIDQFSRCVQAVGEILSEPNDDFDLDDFERIAWDVRHAVEAIDESVFSGDDEGFWFGFYFDVQMGSY